VNPKWFRLIQTGPALKLPQSRRLYVAPVLALGLGKPHLAQGAERGEDEAGRKIALFC